MVELKDKPGEGSLHMPPLTRFADGSGPVFAGKIFPFAFITIACGHRSSR